MYWLLCWVTAGCESKAIPHCLNSLSASRTDLLPMSPGTKSDADATFIKLVEFLLLAGWCHCRSQAGDAVFPGKLNWNGWATPSTILFEFLSLNVAHGSAQHFSFRLQVKWCQNWGSKLNGMMPSFSYNALAPPRIGGWQNASTRRNKSALPFLLHTWGYARKEATWTRGASFACGCFLTREERSSTLHVGLCCGCVALRCHRPTRKKKTETTEEAGDAHRIKSELSSREAQITNPASS